MAKLIEGQCEVCGGYVDSLYDASELADKFGLMAEYNDDDIYTVCPDCLNALEECVRRIWRKKIGGVE